MDTKYSAMIGLWKAIVAFLVALGVGNAAVFSTLKVPETLDDLKANWPTLLIALLAAMAKFVNNWRKNRTPGLGTDGKAGWLPWIIPLVCLVAMGCATTTTLPDGRVIESRIDAQAVALLTTASATLGAQALDLAVQWQDMQDTREAARTERERAEQTARMERWLEAIRAVVAGIQTAQAATP